MVVMNGLRLIAFSFGLLGLIATAVAQDLDELRPQIRYSQDYEQLAEDSEDLGSAPLGEPWKQKSGEASIQSGFGADPSAKQLVITGDRYDWASPWIPVDQARLTKMRMTVTATPNAGGEFAYDSKQSLRAARRWEHGGTCVHSFRVDLADLDR